MRLLAALLFFSMAAFGADCSVDGIVADSITGAPIPRATVTANKTATVPTDSSGKWSFEHIPCGDVAFAVSRPTFLTDAAAHNVTLVSETPLHDVKLRLIPQSVVTGRVLDDFGDPIAGVQVTMMAPVMIDGRRQMVFMGGFGASNDIGEYRVAGLAAGKHVFCANAGMRAVRVRNSETPYGEQCTNPIVLAPGFTSTVDFQLHSVTPRHVRGVISGGPDGVNPQIVLDCGTGAYAAGVGADRKFDITSLASGACVLVASSFDETDRLTATREVMVGGEDIEGVQLHLEKSLTITGIIKTYSVAGAKPDASRFAVFLIPSSRTTPGATQTAWNEDRTAFTFTNVTPGNYRLQFDTALPIFEPAPSFYVRSATIEGRDIAQSEFTAGPGTPEIEVVVSDDGGVIEGDVSVDDHPTVAGVLVLRDGFRHWSGKADAKGHFKIGGIPPGDYQVSAWDDINNVEFANPAWMLSNAKSVAAAVHAGQTTQVKVIRQFAPTE